MDDVKTVAPGATAVRMAAGGERATGAREPFDATLTARPTSMYATSAALLGDGRPGATTVTRAPRTTSSSASAMTWVCTPPGTEMS